MNGVKFLCSIFLLSSIFLQSEESNLLFYNSNIKEVMKSNRDTLNHVGYWIDDAVYKNALFYYGLPPHVRNLIDVPLGNEITYSDLMLYLMQDFNSDISYLELGVSVGKNFYQVTSSLSKSYCLGFEIEKINPVLEKLLGSSTLLEEWESFSPVQNYINKMDIRDRYLVTDDRVFHYDWLLSMCSLSGSLKKDNSSLTRFSFHDNTIDYLNGNIFDENSWMKLAGKKFNFIFSDAFHNTESLYFEFEMIRKYEVLDMDQFVMMWDDLGGIMTTAFMKIYEQMYNAYGDTIEYKLVQVRGWLGVNEAKHTIGIISKGVPLDRLQL